jgi:hypothetical protein
MKIHENQVGLKLCYTYQLLACADNLNLLGYNIDTTKKSTETLTDASKEAGLKVNAEETKYMLLSRHQNAGQSCNIKTGNRCFENVTQFQYLGITVTNPNLILEDIEFGQYLLPINPEHLSFRPLSKTQKLETTILSVVLYGCADFCLTLTEDHRLRVSENRKLRRIFRPKRN